MLKADPWPGGHPWFSAWSHHSRYVLRHHRPSGNLQGRSILQRYWVNCLPACYRKPCRSRLFPRKSKSVPWYSVPNPVRNSACNHLICEADYWLYSVCSHSWPKPEALIFLPDSRHSGLLLHRKAVRPTVYASIQRSVDGHSAHGWSFLKLFPLNPFRRAEPAEKREKATCL